MSGAACRWGRSSEGWSGQMPPPSSRGPTQGDLFQKLVAYTLVRAGPGHGIGVEQQASAWLAEQAKHLIRKLKQMLIVERAMKATYTEFADIPEAGLEVVGAHRARMRRIFQKHARAYAAAMVGANVPDEPSIPE